MRKREMQDRISELEKAAESPAAHAGKQVQAYVDHWFETGTDLATGEELPSVDTALNQGIRAGAKTAAADAFSKLSPERSLGIIARHVSPAEMGDLARIALRQALDDDPMMAFSVPGFDARQFVKDATTDNTLRDKILGIAESRINNPAADQAHDDLERLGHIIVGKLPKGTRISLGLTRTRGGVPYRILDGILDAKEKDVSDYSRPLCVLHDRAAPQAQQGAVMPARDAELFDELTRVYIGSEDDEDFYYQLYPGAKASAMEMSEDYDIIGIASFLRVNGQTIFDLTTGK